jgi:cysteinyl-tRNA synthetase
MEIELLKKDVSVIANLCEKFDTTIDKMQEIASHLSKMISLQEQRLESQEESSKEMQSILEMRRLEHNNDIKELHSRITTVNRELSDKIEETEKAILAELHELRNELRSEKLSLGDRLKKIEVWKYTMVGGLMIVAYISAKVDIFKVLFK